MLEACEIYACEHTDGAELDAVLASLREDWRERRRWWRLRRRRRQQRQQRRLAQSTCDTASEERRRSPWRDWTPYEGGGDGAA